MILLTMKQKKKV